MGEMLSKHAKWIRILYKMSSILNKKSKLRNSNFLVNIKKIQGSGNYFFSCLNTFNVCEQVWLSSKIVWKAVRKQLVWLSETQIWIVIKGYNSINVWISVVFVSNWKMVFNHSIQRWLGMLECCYFIGKKKFIWKK